MKLPDDVRLWFDKADGKTVYGVYTDQRFYSSQYEEQYEGERQDVDALRELMDGFSEWAKANYLSVRGGAGQIALPVELRGLGIPPVLEEIDAEPASFSDSEEG